MGRGANGTTAEAILYGETGARGEQAVAERENAEKEAAAERAKIRNRLTNLEKTSEQIEMLKNFMVVHASDFEDAAEKIYQKNNEETESPKAVFSEYNASSGKIVFEILDRYDNQYVDDLVITDTELIEYLQQSK